MQKNQTKSSLAAIVFALASFNFSAFGQDKVQHSPAPITASSNISGFWNTESNVSNPKSTIVSFYLNDKKNSLLYEEKVDEVCIEIENQQAIKKLNAALASVLSLYEKKQLSNKEDIVASLFKYWDCGLL